MAKGSALRKPSNDAASAEFAALLDESLGGASSFEGTVVKGTVVRIANDFVVVDVGLKSEGRVPLREFANGGVAAEVPHLVLFRAGQRQAHIDQVAGGVPGEGGVAVAGHYVVANHYGTIAAYRLPKGTS